MPPLDALQADFASAVRDAGRDVPDEISRQNGCVAEKRFNVYRNNIYVSLIEVLRQQFPAVERLVGSEFFGSLARVYAVENLPASPVMIHYGNSFPAFLETFERVQALPYLADIARIEFAWAEAYHAADCEPAAAGELAEIPAEQFGDVMFGLHPSIGVIASPYPVYSIWKANTSGGPDEDVPEISLEEGGEDVLIVRPHLDVWVYEMGVGGARFVSALQQGLTLNQAFEATAEDYGDFDLQPALAQLIQVGAITGYRMACKSLN